MLAEAAVANPPPASTAKAVSRDAMVMRMRVMKISPNQTVGYGCTR